MKKILGQNFLVNKTIAQKIVAGLNIEDNDFVVEVGPGRGALTDFLAEKKANILAIEKDRKLVNFLRQRYKAKKNVKIISGDILKCQTSNVKCQNYKLISNLPYSITSFFINKFFVDNEIKKPKEAVLMLQKEVAERLASEPGEKNRGVLTVLLQVSWKVKNLFDVSRVNFKPVPRVDSAVLKLVPTGTKKLDSKFILLVKAGFSAKRKKLINSLARRLNIPKEKLSAIMRSANINLDSRAEDLIGEEWQELSIKF